MCLSQDVRSLDALPRLGCVQRRVYIDVHSAVSRNRDQSALSLEVIWPGRDAPQIELARHQAQVVAPA